MGNKVQNLVSRLNEMQRLIYENRSRLDCTVRDHGYMTHALSVGTEALQVIEQYEAARISILRLTMDCTAPEIYYRCVKDILDVLNDQLTEDMGDPNI